MILYIVNIRDRIFFNSDKYFVFWIQRYEISTIYLQYRGETTQIRRVKYILI